MSSACCLKLVAVYVRPVEPYSHKQLIRPEYTLANSGSLIPDPLGSSPHSLITMLTMGI